MKPYRTKPEKRRIVRLRTVFLCCVFVLVFICGCARDAARNERAILCTDDAHAAVLAEYTDVPVFCEDDVPRAWRGKTLFERVCGGAVCQTIDAKALPMMDNAIAAKWAPQYLTTPVIAVDRTPMCGADRNMGRSSVGGLFRGDGRKRRRAAHDHVGDRLCASGRGLYDGAGAFPVSAAAAAKATDDVRGGRGGDPLSGYGCRRE